MDKLLAYLAANPEALRDLYLAASEIVDDFDDYGPVLQATEDGDYDAGTAIGRLKTVRNGIVLAVSGYSPSGESLR